MPLFKPPTVYDVEFIDNDIKFSKDKTDYEITVKNNIEKLAFCYKDGKEDNTLCVDGGKISYSDKTTVAITLNDVNILDTINKSNKSDNVVVGNLKIGNNVLKIKVLAENETTKEYVFNINRLNAENKSVVQNPGTGIGGIGIILPCGLIIIGSFIYFKKKNKYRNN